MPREEVIAEVRRAIDLAANASDAVVVVEEGDPQTAIVDQAVSIKADLIVMGTHGRRGFKRLLLGSVTETVLREAPCPVLTVPLSAHAPPTERMMFKRILCPIDFWPSALQGWDLHWTWRGKPTGV